MASAASDEDATVTHTRNHIDFLLQNSPLYSHLFQDIKLVSARPGYAVMRLPLTAILLNSKGTLHGSVSATLVDFMGGVAIASSDTSRTNTGVSTDMHLSFVGVARLGDTLEIEGTAEKVGGTLAYTRVTIRKAVEGGGQGDIVAIGSHTKFVKTRS